MKITGFSDGELDRFLEYQRRSFAVQQSVMDALHEGITEREVARLLVARYRAEGVQAYFHLPVVLFGERTTLPDPWTVLSFWPTDRALRVGDAVILDASPIFGDVLVDTSQSCCFGADPDHAVAVADDRSFRAVVLDAVRAGATFREIAVAVDHRLRDTGYQNRHVLHPGEVIGHRVMRLERDAEPDADGFDQRLIGWFVEHIAAAVPPGRPSPTWNHLEGSDHAPADGLWAVEPHIARGDIGVKWEELLVIQGGDVRWLDDARG